MRRFTRSVGRSPRATRRAALLEEIRAENPGLSARRLDKAVDQAYRQATELGLPSEEVRVALAAAIARERIGPRRSFERTPMTVGRARSARRL